MIKHYKNLCGNRIATTFFGCGDVNIPAEAKCIELEDYIAEAINAMAFPNVILEEVEVVYSLAEDAIATPPENVSDDVVQDTIDDVVDGTIDDVVQDTIGVSNPWDLYSKDELKALCESRDIHVTAKDTKESLYNKLY